MMATADLRLRKEFRPGDELEKYVLLERIGVGGEAVVWSAWDTNQEHVAAIKLTPVPEHAIRFETGIADPEVYFATSLEHPNILAVYDAGATEGFTYISMRYLPFGSIKDLLNSGPIPPQEVLRLSAQIVAALEYLHAKNVVHRDLKPTNVLVDAQKRAYLTDFGLAKPLSQTTQVFHTGQGTAPYSPPEQHTRASLTHSSDIYSLGIMLFEMFTGTLPWGGDIALAVRQLDTGEQLPDPCSVNPALPVTLAGALRTLTAADRANRPATVSEAFGLVVAALVGDQDRHVTREVGVLAIKKILRTLPPLQDAEVPALKDAEHLLQRAMAAWEPGKEEFKLSLTDFAFIDSVYSKAERHGLALDDSICQFMLRGALTYGFNRNHWWQKLSDPASRLQVCEQVIANESEAAVQHALIQMLKEPPRVSRTADLSTPTATRLIDLALESPDAALCSNALELLGQAAGSTKVWKPVRYTADDDAKLAALALADHPQADQAARLIGQLHSEAAVRALQDSLEGGNTKRGLSALVEVCRAAGSLPRSLPASVVLPVSITLARQQLFADRATLLKAYLAAALAGALGLSFHVYVLLELPSFMAATRIINSLGNGLLFGPLIGLGIFLTRLVVHRLKVMSLLPRMALGIALGTLGIYLGVVGHHVLYLDSAPRGWLITFGSALWALGFGASAGLFRSRVLRILFSVLMVGLGIGLSWQLALGTSSTPMLLYDSNRPVQTIMMILVTSILVGSIAHVIDLVERNGNM